MTTKERIAKIISLTKKVRESYTEPLNLPEGEPIIDDIYCLLVELDKTIPDEDSQ